MEIVAEFVRIPSNKAEFSRIPLRVLFKLLMGSGRSQASDRPASTAVGHPLDTLFGPWFAAILAKFEKSCRPRPICSAGTHKLSNWGPIAATRGSRLWLERKV